MKPPVRRCAVCLIPSGLQRFRLRHADRAAGSIDLCASCWAEATRDTKRTSPAQSRRWERATPEERRRFGEAVSRSLKATWARYSPEEKARRTAAMLAGRRAA